MALKVFIDVNIIVDYALKRPQGYVHARQILQAIVDKQLEGYTGPVVIHIAAHLLKKVLGVDQAKEIVMALLNDVVVLNTNQEIIKAAMSSSMSDMEDALQYFTALHYQMDILITRDKDFVRHSPQKLTILAPDDFAAKYLRA